MKFTINTSRYFYPKKEERTELEKIGFTFKPSDYKEFTIVGEPTIKIKDLNELIQFADKWGEIIVGNGTIEIYNDYRE
jgi:wyosine [tRNA(Phe)-imidazoG37] synthetase (radical SAM superfamily)